MSTREEKMDELFNMFARKEQEIAISVGMGIEDFKDDLWRAIRVAIEPESALQASSWITHQITQQIADSISVKGRGHYDILVCIKKNTAIPEEKVDAVMKEAEKKRKTLVDEFQIEFDKVKAEFPYVPKSEDL